MISSPALSVVFNPSSAEWKIAVLVLGAGCCYHVLRFYFGPYTRASPPVAAHPLSDSGVILSWYLGLSCYRLLLDLPQGADSPPSSLLQPGVYEGEVTGFPKIIVFPQYCFWFWGTSRKLYLLPITPKPSVSSPSHHFVKFIQLRYFPFFACGDHKRLWDNIYLALFCFYNFIWEL